GYAMHMKGSGFTVWGISLGIALQSAPGLSCAYDVSPQKGLMFWLKANVTDMTMRVNLITEETLAKPSGGECLDGALCNDHWGFDLQMLDGTWQQHTVWWADLAQEGWGAPKQLVLEHVINIEFEVHKMTNFDVWVDQVEFF